MHIFTAWAAMVGVCLTVIGIIRIVISPRHSDMVAEDMLAVNALLYLASCLLSCWALCTRRQSRNDALERLADVTFLLSLTSTAISASYMTWAISVH